MDKRYLLAEKTIDETDLADLIGWLQSNPWLTQGALVKEFEQRWAAWMGMPYAVFVNSGSSANLLMYYALLLSNQLKNRRVIVPAVSWATTVAPAIQLGFEPILCEADRDTFGLDLNHLEQLLQQYDPGAVIMVHVLGVPNSMEPILALKERYGFMLMEDSCAATGSRYDGNLVGSFGDLSSFSFYFGHHLSTIEGGMICTASKRLHDLLLCARSHGWAKDLDSSTEAELAKSHRVIEFNRTFSFYHPGFNVRSTDLNARIGLSQMKKVDWVVGRRIENHRIYQTRFAGSPDFICQHNDRATICSISFAALANSEEHRERVAKALAAAGIETRPLGGGNMSRQPFWAERYGTVDLPMSDRIHTTSFHLPNHPQLTSADINFICDQVLAVKADQQAKTAA
jgi:CDP-6-deoxy-D-xylo-4-hexulose-3-dehydrase